MHFRPSKGRPEIIEKILNVLSADTPKTCREVVQETGIKTATASLYLREILKDRVVGEKSEQLRCYLYVLKE